MYTTPSYIVKGLRINTHVPDYVCDMLKDYTQSVKAYPFECPPVVYITLTLEQWNDFKSAINNLMMESPKAIESLYILDFNHYCQEDRLYDDYILYDTANKDWFENADAILRKMAIDQNRGEIFHD